MALFNAEKITYAILGGLNLKQVTEPVKGKIAELQGLCNSLLQTNLVSRQFVGR